MQALVPGNQLVGECEARHEAAFLEPEDGTEASREVDALHAGKGHQPLSKTAGSSNPVKGPLSFLLYTGNGFYGLRVFDLDCK